MMFFIYFSVLATMAPRSFTGLHTPRAELNSYVDNPATTPHKTRSVHRTLNRKCTHTQVQENSSAICDACTGNQQTVEKKLKHCPYYHGNITADDATERLQTTPEGTYLLRDSSHPSYAYCLSIRTMTGVTSVRISFKNGHYRLDTSLPADECDVELPCVLQLIEHYQNLSKAKTKTGKSKWVVVGKNFMNGKNVLPLKMLDCLVR